MIKGIKRLLPLCTAVLLLAAGCAGDDARENAGEVTALEAGETSHLIKGTEVTLHLKETYETEELTPSNPSGYFYYYEDKEEYYYYVVAGTLKNPSQTLLSPSDFGAAAWNGRKEYETKVVMENSTGATFMENDDETAGEEIGVYILVMVKDGEEAPEQIEIYYNEGLSEKNGDELWDRGIRIDPSHENYSNE